MPDTAKNPLNFRTIKKEVSLSKHTQLLDGAISQVSVGTESSVSPLRSPLSALSSSVSKLRFFQLTWL